MSSIRSEKKNETDGKHLNAYDYSTRDIMRILDPNKTNDIKIVRGNLTYYMRRTKGDAEYSRFFQDVQDILVKKGLFGIDVGSETNNDKGEVATDTFDASSYSLVDLAKALGHDLSSKPDLSALMREKLAYMRRLAADSSDTSEERENKARARRFFDDAYERLLNELYPSKADVAVSALPTTTSSLGEAASLNQRRPERSVGQLPPQPPPPTSSSQMASVQPSPQMAVVESSSSSSSLQAVGAPRSAKKTRKYTINVDTRFRSHYFDKARADITQTSDINFSLDERLRNVRRVSLASFEFPNSSYAISSSLRSNVFYVQVIKNMYQTFENGSITSFQGDFRHTNMARDLSMQHYIDYKGVHRQTTGGAVGIYRVTMMSGNYNRESLVTAVNIALRTSDVTTGLSAIYLESNSAYNRLILRNIDLSSSDATHAESILYTGQIVTRNGTMYRGANPLGGLLANQNYDFSFNVFFDLYEQIDASGNYDLQKKTPNRPLYFNVGWIFGFRKERYVHDEDDPTKSDYNIVTPNAIHYDKTTFEDSMRSYFPGYNAEAPYDINHMRYFYICLTDFVTNGTGNVIQGIRDPNTGVHSMYGLPSDVIARIVNNGPKLHYTFYDRSDFINKSREYDMPVTLQNFRIRIVDEYGRSLDLNMMDWSGALEVECEID